MFEDMPNPYKDLYIWDSLEKRGFPISEHIRCIHMDSEPGRRAFIAGASAAELDELMQQDGVEMTEIMLEVLKTFTALLFRIYADQPEEKRQEILQLIRGLAGE